MSLDPFFSLSPLNPFVYTYNPADPDAPHARANLWSFGGTTYCFRQQSLTSQHENDRLLVAYDPVMDTDQTAANLDEDLFRRSAIRADFTARGVNADNQFLLVFRLARAFGSPIAQVFVGTEFVQAEPLTGTPYDDIAILLDVPGNNVSVYMFVRLAASDGNASHGFFFQGVDCYLL